MLPLLTAADEAAPLGKVELDLEGAPFLEPEPEPEADDEPVGQAKQRIEELEEGAPQKSRKRLFIGIGIIFVALVVAGILTAYYTLFRGGESKLDPAGPRQVVVPSTPPPDETAPTSKFNISWEPFWVEVADPEGEIRFVYCKILLVTDNQRIALQIASKDAAMRDAVYYYLRNKPYSFLADLRQLDVLKKEILNIINYYILPETVIPPGLQPGEAPPPSSPKEQLKEILIEEYLIK